MAVKKGLGRGLDALLDELDLEEKENGQIEQVSLYDIGMSLRELTIMRV